VVYLQDVRKRANSCRYQGSVADVASLAGPQGPTGSAKLVVVIDNAPS
jgi:hypothetical protein